MVNRKMLRVVLGRILQIEAILFILPLLVAFIYREPWINKLAFIGTMAITLILGTLLALKLPDDRNMYTRDGLMIVALSWMMLSFFGALPFVISGQIPNFIDAFFETVSGFTTTGSTILNNVAELSHSMLFWRSFTHLIGGMGVLVLALAIVPASDAHSVHLMKAEVPGPSFGKLVARMRATARILYAIYLVMTVILIIILWAVGMPLFDSLIHAFGAAGTGGFSSMPGSVADYNSPVITYVLGVGMLLFGVNFNLYYMILIGQTRRIFKSEELRAYLGIMLGASIAIAINVRHLFGTFGEAFRESFFTASSLMTTTGYSTADFSYWPTFSKILLLLLMFIGGSAGSTAGGLKVSRVLIMFKMAIREARQSKEPRRVLPLLYDKKALSREQHTGILHYFVVYVFLFLLILLFVALDAPSFDVAFSAVAATLNNIGPGFDVIGPAGSFDVFSLPTKALLSVSMLLGRLEIYPVLFLFSALRRR